VSHSDETLRVLLVEDEPLVREFLIDVLRQQGFDVEEVEDAAIALRRLRSSRPDVVLSDVSMPSMSGLELLATLRRDPDLCALPLVLMSGDQSNEGVALGGGAAAFVHKPVGDPAKLAQVLRGIVPSSPSLDALVSAMESLPYGVVMTDREGRVTWANRRFTNYCRYPLRELRGRKPGRILQGPGTSQAVVERIRVAVGKGRPVREGLLNYDAQGREYWANLEIEPTYGDGIHSGFVCLVQATRPQTNPPPPRDLPAKSGIAKVYANLQAAAGALQDSVRDQTAPPALHAALVGALAEVLQLQGVTEWIRDGLADLSSDAHPALPGD